MNHFETIFHSVTQDPRYLANLDWGKPRRGHPEGTVRAHIAELEDNLKALDIEPGSDAYWKLKILIHVHDSFKAQATPKVPISHPASHASLARAFLSRHCKDRDLLAMTQLHDESYAIWRKIHFGGELNEARLNKLLHAIKDWRLFLQFMLIDGATDGKDLGPLEWASQTIAPRVGLERETLRDLKTLRGDAKPRGKRGEIAPVGR